MNEKEMVSDYLAGLNSSLASYGGIIAQCENESLRQTIQGMRNGDEVRQYNWFKKQKKKAIIYQQLQLHHKKLKQLKIKCLRVNNI